MYAILDRSSGNGSRKYTEDWLDENTTAKEDRFAKGRTTFRPDDAPSHLQRKYEWLRDRHNGKWAKDRDRQLKKAMIRVDAEAFCDVLNLSSVESQEVQEIIEDSDMSSNNYGGKPYEKVVVAICSLVSDKYTDDFDNRIVNTERFGEILEHVDMSRGEHKRLRQAVRERSVFKQSEQ